MLCLPLQSLIGALSAVTSVTQRERETGRIQGERERERKSERKKEGEREKERERERKRERDKERGGVRGRIEGERQRARRSFGRDVVNAILLVPQISSRFDPLTDPLNYRNARLALTSSWDRCHDPSSVVSSLLPPSGKTPATRSVFLIDPAQ